VFHEATGHRPHVIINHLHRAKLDANRDRFEGAQGNPAAELAWLEFHAFAEAALAEVRERHGRGFFVDLHAHGHQAVRIELGYLLNGGMLAEIPDFLNAQYERTSIRTLVEETGLTLIELLRGPTSLGAFLAERGYPAVPSPVIPHPGGHAFFSGGYNTERYGSRDGGPISGVQLEAPIIGHLDTAQNRLGFARAFLRAFDAFFAAHYGGLVPPG
jgi:hypothetical protein